MKIIEIKQLAIPDVKIIRFERFVDERGYFAETFRQRDIEEIQELNFLKKFRFVQINENYSRAGVIKGLHFQWQPPLGKLLRVVSGHMVDMVLDIRRNSPAEGKIILYDMPSSRSDAFGEWIWLPPGLAHGNFFLEDSIIEYLFTSYYNPKGESGISPLSKDFDWSLCEPILKEKYELFKNGDFLIKDKDKNGLSFSEWQKDGKSENFIYV